MPKKRKSRGRHKGDKGKEGYVQCDRCGALVPRSKAVRVTVNSLPLDPQLISELRRQGAIIPRYTIVKNYCIRCAIHYRIIKIRPEEQRKVREPVARKNI
ncbi:MAG: 30S ribosomal protein S26e [Thermoprotei archaeon]|nr:MAG: 30S ribosomal protein S26e [Thermoprotei archaeon]RLF20259.1 MAG: 30S ribosomal protein S26e [Thermoprotei archaeon]